VILVNGAALRMPDTAPEIVIILREDNIRSPEARPLRLRQPAPNGCDLAV